MVDTIDDMTIVFAIKMYSRTYKRNPSEFFFIKINIIESQLNIGQTKPLINKNSAQICIDLLIFNRNCPYTKQRRFAKFHQNRLISATCTLVTKCGKGK